MTAISLAAMTAGNLSAAGILKRYRPTQLVAVEFCDFVMRDRPGGTGQFRCGWVLAAQILTGLGGGVGYPILMGMSIQKVADEERTTAMGVFQSVYSIGMFGGPWLSGILAARIGIPFMLAVTAVGVCLLGLAGTFRLKTIFFPARQTQPLDD